MQGELGDHVQALVYTNVNDVIFHLRVEGDRYRFLAINAAFTRATGLEPSQVVGKYVEDVIPEPSLSLALQKYREATDERRTVRWEEVTDYPTGRKIGEVSVTPVIEPSGRCTQLVGTVSDVTELRMQRDALQVFGDIARSIDLGLSVWAVPDPEDLSSIRLLGANDAATSLLGALQVDERDAQLAPLIAEVARDRRVRVVPSFHPAKQPRQVLALKLFPLAESSVVLTADDITVNYRATQQQLAERRALEMLASGAPLRDILTVIVRMIEEQHADIVASILLLDDTGTRLRSGAAPRLPDEYNRLLDGVPISAESGSCGTAAFRGEPVYVADITTDPLWAKYRDLAALVDMRACWSTPIRSAAGHVLGTFALYRRSAGLPDAALLDFIGRATHIAAIVLERRHIDEELRALTEHVENIREDERTGIAREIHDELGQALTALKLDVAWIGRRTGKNQEIEDKLAEMLDLTDRVIASVRRISAELRPGILDDVGLAAALEWQASEFEARTGIAVRVRSDLGQARLDRGLTTTVFRIYQEALTNVTRHAQATRVDVSMEIGGGELRLEIVDNGIGVPDAGQRRGLGIVGMQERARRLGGECTIARRDGGGTVVSLRVPIGSVQATPVT